MEWSRDGATRVEYLSRMEPVSLCLIAESEFKSCSESESLSGSWMTGSLKVCFNETFLPILLMTTWLFFFCASGVDYYKSSLLFVFLSAIISICTLSSNSNTLCDILFISLAELQAWVDSPDDFEDDALVIRDEKFRPAFWLKGRLSVYIVVLVFYCILADLITGTNAYSTWKHCERCTSFFSSLFSGSFDLAVLTLWSLFTFTMRRYCWLDKRSFFT